MSIHNATNRRRTPQGKKRDFYRKESRNYFKYPSGARKTWRERKQRTNRSERRNARHALKPIKQTQLVEEDVDLLKDRCEPSKLCKADVVRPGEWFEIQHRRRRKLANRKARRATNRAA